jgi:hypothetical protein
MKKLERLGNPFEFERVVLEDGEYKGHGAISRVQNSTRLYKRNIAWSCISEQFAENVCGVIGQRTVNSRLAIVEGGFKGEVGITMDNFSVEGYDEVILEEIFPSFDQEPQAYIKSPFILQNVDLAQMFASRGGIEGAGNQKLNVEIVKKYLASVLVGIIDSTPDNNQNLLIGPGRQNRFTTSMLIVTPMYDMNDNMHVHIKANKTVADSLRLGIPEENVSFIMKNFPDVWAKFMEKVSLLRKRTSHICDFTKAKRFVKESGNGVLNLDKMSTYAEKSLKKQIDVILESGGQ